MTELYVCNRQRRWPINLSLLQTIARDLMTGFAPGEFELGVIVVGARQMAQLNEGFLQHAGPTDVITFGYGGKREPVQGEIFICVDEALRQARRFRIPWQKELIRYLVHGILHLQGYDDVSSARRLRMKRAENALVQQLEERFCLSDLSPGARVA